VVVWWCGGAVVRWYTNKILGAADPSAILGASGVEFLFVCTTTSTTATIACVCARLLRQVSNSFCCFALFVHQASKSCTHVAFFVHMQHVCWQQYTCTTRQAGMSGRTFSLGIAEFSGNDSRNPYVEKKHIDMYSTAIFINTVNGPRYL
jgi:hypothetical protein